MRLRLRRDGPARLSASAGDLETLVEHLRRVAPGLNATDREALMTAAALLHEIGEYLQRTGALTP